jgi:hypothetical protein
MQYGPNGELKLYDLALGLKNIDRYFSQVIPTLKIHPRTRYLARDLLAHSDLLPMLLFLV